MRSNEWPIEVDGVLYINPIHTCELLGISKTAFYKCKRTKQISTEEVIRHYLYKTERIVKIKVSIKKEKEEKWSLLKHCKDRGLSYPIMYRNMKKLGMSLEEAERKAIHNDKYEVEYKGRRFRSLYDACIIMNLPYQKIYHRMRRGLTFEKAVDKDREKVIA